MLGMVLVGLIGLVDLRVYVALTVLRQLALLLRIRTASAPIRDWQHAKANTSLLGSASDAVDSMVSRVVSGAVLGWGVMLGAVIGLPRLGLLSSRVIGGPELMFGVLLIVSVMLAMVPLLGQVLERVLLDVRIELGAARLDQRLAPGSKSVSLMRQLVFVNVATTTAIVIGFAAITTYEHANRVRSEALAAQRDNVSLTATQLREGLREPATLPELGLELVSFDQLPAQLELDKSNLPGPSETVAVVDVRHELAIAAAPVDDGRWVLARVEVDQKLGWVSLLLVVFVSGCTSVGVFTGMALHRVLTTPVAQLDEATRRVAEQGDLRSVGRIIPLRNDELGALANNFNRMLDMLDELTSAAAAVAKGDLRVEIHGTGDLPDALRGMLARLNEVVEQIRSTSLELASAAAEIHTIIAEQEKGAEQQSQRVLVVSDTIASLAESAEDISTISTEVLENAEHALSTTNAMIEKINLLSAQAGSVRALLDLIREVADRSDLLALNGALEATRAGDAGRGFALVAAEMRRLAERVTGTVGDVRERLADIEAAGAGTIRATAESQRLADSTATAARKISTVTHHQSEETERVSHKVFEVAEGMIATVEAAKQTLTATDGLRRQAAELEGLTRQFILREPGTVTAPNHPAGVGATSSSRSPAGSVDPGSLARRS
jgi:methyl-accepting chemotaxis protein